MGSTVIDKRQAPPIRSLVHVAAAHEKALGRAMAVGADALFLDLEEPQFPYGARERERARGAVGEYLRSVTDNARRPLNFVRVNHPRTGLTTGDLRAVMTPALAGVHLPKAAGPEDIHALDGILTCMELEHGLPSGSTQIFPFLETAQGMRRAYDIASASPRVTYLGGMVSRFGDVYQALRYRWTPDGHESAYLRSKVLLDARAAGVRYPVSGGWGGASDDVTGLRAWAESLRDMGYFGMLTGADGVELTHEVFSPKPDEVDFWRTLVELGDAASSGDGDPIHFQWPEGQRSELHNSYVESARINLRWAHELGL
jgi:citrate lyase subunit beta/citryl-CoA lyase